MTSAVSFPRPCHFIDNCAIAQVGFRAKLQEFESLLTTLGRALQKAGPSRGLGAAAVAKPGAAASHGTSVPMSAARRNTEKPGPMSPPRVQRAASGDEDPETGYSGIHSIRDSTGEWRWIVTAADTEGKARSFPVDAGKHFALQLACPCTNVKIQGPCVLNTLKCMIKLILSLILIIISRQSGWRLRFSSCVCMYVISSHVSSLWSSRTLMCHCSSAQWSDVSTHMPVLVQMKQLPGRQTSWRCCSALRRMCFPTLTFCRASMESPMIRWRAL